MKHQALSPAQQDAFDAAAFRQLLDHLDARKDVQNIDLMVLADFCRNCLAKWYRAAAGQSGVDITDTEAREHIYGMPYADWKAAYQTPASAEKMAAFEARKKS